MSLASEVKESLKASTKKTYGNRNYWLIIAGIAILFIVLGKRDDENESKIVTGSIALALAGVAYFVLVVRKRKKTKSTRDEDDDLSFDTDRV